MFELLTRLATVFVVALLLLFIMALSAKLVGYAVNLTDAPSQYVAGFAVLLLAGVAFTVAILVGSFVHVKRR